MPKSQTAKILTPCGRKRSALNDVVGLPNIPSRKLTPGYVTKKEPRYQAVIRSVRLTKSGPVPISALTIGT